MNCNFILSEREKRLRFVSFELRKKLKRALAPMYGIIVKRGKREERNIKEKEKEK
jgi:hypothetical protein